MKATNLTRQQSLAISRGLVAPTAARSFSWVEDMTNGEGADIPEGSVVVVVSDGTIELADTLNDPRPVGVALDTIDDGETGQVAFGGPVDKVLTTGSVAAGDFGQTSTTPGQAQTAPSGPTAFLEFTESGTDPSAFLWGGRGGGGFGGLPGSLPWFIVTDYGATGDGTTDDTSAINAAIDALIAAGCGVLYFPCGHYKVTAALTTITVPGLVLGDGNSGESLAADATSLVDATFGNADLFTVSTHNLGFAKLALLCSAGSVTSGAGIHVTGSGNGCHYEQVSVTGFYTNWNIEYGAWWTMTDCFSRQNHLYGARIHNATNEDGGDWSMSGCYFVDGLNSSTAAIRIEGAGGGKIVNTKVNSSPSVGFNYAIDMAITIQTSVLTIANCSFENVRSHIIHFTSSGTSRWHSIDITGTQFSTQTTSGANAIFISAGTLADFKGLTISGCVFKAWNVTTAACISLTKVDLAVISAIINDGFASMLTTSGCTNILDATGGIAVGVAVTGTPSSGQIPVASTATAAAWTTPALSASSPFATPAVVLGSAAVSGAASTVIRSDSTIAAFDSTVPSADGTAATGSAAFASRADHVHPASAGLSAHAHVVSETHLSNGSATTYTLDQNFELGSVIAWNITTLARLGVTETAPDQATVSAAGSSGDSIVFDYAATIA